MLRGLATKPPSVSSFRLSLRSLWPFAPVEAMPLEMLKRLEEEELRAAKGLPKVTDSRWRDLW